MLTPEPPPLILQRIRTVIDLLRIHGMQYEDVIGQQYPDYDFIYPKSPYYQLYTQQLLLHLPPDTPQHHTAAPIVRSFEGTIEELPVGAMSQIIRQELRQGHTPYEPLDNSIYQHRVTYDPHDLHLASKVTHLLDKYAPLLGSVKSQISKQENPKPKDKSQVFRKELGTNSDGSLGVYSGRRYEGLGVHDEFSQFRRELSQQYYSTIQEKRQN